jgi:hypothetical protein
MIRRSGLVVAAILVAASLAFPVSTATPAAAEPLTCGNAKTFYGLGYYACIQATTNTFTATLYGYRTGAAYSYGGVKLAVRITSNGNRVTGKVCESATIDSQINSGFAVPCTVQTPRGHTGATVRSVGWVAFDVRCGNVPPCLGYHSSYPNLASSPGIIS